MGLYRLRAVSRSMLMALVAAFFFADDAQRKAFAGVFQNAFRLLGLLENFADLRQRSKLW